MKKTDDIIARLNAAASSLGLGDGAREPSGILAALPAAVGSGGGAPLRMRVVDVSSHGGMEGIPLCGKPEPGCEVCADISGSREVLEEVRTTVSGDGDAAICHISPVVQGVAPGDVLYETAWPVSRSDLLSADLAWFGDAPLFPGREYRLLSLAGERTATVIRLKGRLVSGGVPPMAARKLERGEAGHLELSLDTPLTHDGTDPETPLSWFLLVDPASGAPSGVGRIRFAPRRARNVRWQDLPVDKALRAAGMGQRPFVLWFTGLSGSGKSTLAGLVERKLQQMGRKTYLLDGDNVRHGLCADLGFTQADRIENMRRIVEVARLMVDAGLIVLVSFISPFRRERDRARRAFEEGEFVEVHVATPLEVCERRDPKGLYARARAGRIPNFTGISSPYEPPEAPEIRVSGTEAPERMAEAVVGWLRDRGMLDPYVATVPNGMDVTGPDKASEG